MALRDSHSCVLVTGVRIPQIIANGIYQLKYNVVFSAIKILFKAKSQDIHINPIKNFQFIVVIFPLSLPYIPILVTLSY